MLARTRVEPAPGGKHTVRKVSPAGFLRLAPWSRAVGLSLRRPVVFVAVLGAAAVMACAASSASLFLSSSSSESLRVQLAGQCPDAAFPVLQQVGFGPGFTAQPDLNVSATEALRGVGLPAPYRVVAINSAVGVSTAAGVSTLGTVLFRDGALGEVAVLSRGAGEGLVLPSTTAQYLGVAPGDEVRIGQGSFPVVGTYRDMYTEESVRPFWCSYTGLFLNPGSGAAPPALILATSPGVVEAAGVQDSPQGMDRSWISPVNTERLTLPEATRIVGQRAQAFAESRIANDSGGEGTTGLLPTMTETATAVTAGLRGPVIPIAAGGALLALLLMGAAGSFWADRRASELRLLTSRGIAPLAIGIKALLEAAVPALIGTAAGWFLARALIMWVGPSPDVDAAAPVQAAITSGAALVAGLLLLAAVAAARTRGRSERPLGGRSRLPARLPWELFAVAAAVVAYLRLRESGGVIQQGNVAQVRLLLVGFPLLALAGAAVLAARLLVVLLARLRAKSQRWHTSSYTAIRRMTGAPLVTGGLFVAVTLPIAVFAYSAALTVTSQTTLEAKAQVVVGSELALVSVDRPSATPTLDEVGTVVARYPYATVDGEDVTVLALDPRTFARWAFWDDRFASEPLNALMADLPAKPGAGPVPGIVVGLPDGPVVVRLGERDVTVQPVHTATTFPGRRQTDPMIIVDATALGEIDRSAGRTTEIWSTRDAATVRAALDDDIRIQRVLTRDTVFDVANFLSVSWTFGYLQALAALIGVVGLGGLLLYLETRQRARTASYVLTRRMGLTRANHLRSLLAELGSLLCSGYLLGAALGWLAVLTVYEMTDIDPVRPPSPLLTFPTVPILGAAVGVVLITTLAALTAQRTADHANPAQVLRMGQT